VVDTATMVRTARQRAGLTQAALAKRAHTSAPTISAYEHGTRQPRADVLLRLLNAAGAEPILVPSSTGSTRYVDLLCDALADHVRDTPAVIDRARAELDRMRPNDNVRAWQSILDAGPSAVVAVLTSRDPDARGLKADNPFARLGLIDEDTRLQLLDQARGR
jgi:transcriptional regulator with XRE-family HTH domain